MAGGQAGRRGQAYGNGRDLQDGPSYARCHRLAPAPGEQQRRHDQHAHHVRDPACLPGCPIGRMQGEVEQGRSQRGDGRGDEDGRHGQELHQRAYRGEPVRLRPQAVQQRRGQQDLDQIEQREARHDRWSEARDGAGGEIRADGGQQIGRPVAPRRAQKNAQRQRIRRPDQDDAAHVARQRDRTIRAQEVRREQERRLAEGTHPGRRRVTEIHSTQCRSGVPPQPRRRAS